MSLASTKTIEGALATAPWGDWRDGEGEWMYPLNLARLWSKWASTAYEEGIHVRHTTRGGNFREAT